MKTQSNIMIKVSKSYSLKINNMDIMTNSITTRINEIKRYIEIADDTLII